MNKEKRKCNKTEKETDQGIRVGKVEEERGSERGEMEKRR